MSIPTKSHYIERDSKATARLLSDLKLGSSPDNRLDLRAMLSGSEAQTD
jgi:hypothetical protein